MGTYRDLLVYRESFQLALEIQEITSGFPAVEKYSLTDQLRRSSRSVCVNIAEAFRKLKYKAHFVAKITDADMENSESIVWVEFCAAFGYIDVERSKNLIQRFEKIGRLLNHIIHHPEKYGA